MVEVKEILGKAEEKMEEAVLYLEEALAHIRAGKANVKILDGIRVDSYGSMVPLNQVAAINTPDARTIAIKPWDKSMFRPIEKAIMDSNVGITPENNGEIIRLGIPPLTEERRKQLAKQCGKEGEQAKVSIRNTRREIIEKLKKSNNEGISEDLEKDEGGRTACCQGEGNHDRLMRGLIVRNTGSWYTVKTDDGRLFDCKVKGTFRLKGIRSTNPVAVGDMVTITPSPDSLASSVHSC